MLNAQKETKLNSTISVYVQKVCVLCGLIDNNALSLAAKLLKEFSLVTLFNERYISHIVYDLMDYNSQFSCTEQLLWLPFLGYALSCVHVLSMV